MDGRFVNTLGDESSIAQVGSDIWNKVWDTASNVIDTAGNNLIKTGSVNPPVTPQPVTPQPQPNNGLVSSIKQVNPLILGGIAGGIIYFATKRPLFAGLAAAGTWFFTDKMQKG